jgi:hypothetical protein
MTAEAPSPHPGLDDLAVTMFRLFSRLEYALKATNYLQSADGDAKANWGSFADRIEPMLAALTDPKFLAARDYLLAEPPRKQVVRSGKLDWDAGKPEGQSVARQLTTYVCRVRNNLFHGGKFHDVWFDPERSEALLGTSLTILEHFITLDDDVRTAFWVT